MRRKAITAALLCAVCLGAAAPSPAAPIDSAYTSTVYILLAPAVSESPSESPSPSVSPSLSPMPFCMDAELSTPAPQDLSADSPAPQDTGTGSPVPPDGDPTAAPVTALYDTPPPSAPPTTQAPGEPAETVPVADSQPPAPDYSIEPDVTDTPAPTPDTAPSSLDALLAEEPPAGAPTAEPAATPFAGTVSIRMNAPAQLHLGDTVELTAALEGYDGISVHLQWQYTRDGVNWSDAQGANGYTYTFTVDTQTAGTGWRLSVTAN